MKLLKKIKARLEYALAHVAVKTRLDQRADFLYQKSPHSLLNALCDTYGSDKGEIVPDGHPYPWPSHTYAYFYELLFQLKRQDVRAVLECGLGTNNPNVTSNMGVKGRPGASLRVWRDFFPQAQIIGVDIDAGVLFEEERIKTYQCDQTSADSIASFVERAQVQPTSMDIIIDDGLHEFAAGVSFFENTIDYLTDDGLYIIEDVNAKDYQKYAVYFSDRSDRYVAKFINGYRPKSWMGNNRLIVVSKILR